MKRAAGLACSPASGTTVASFSTIYLLLSFAFPVEQTLGFSRAPLHAPNNSSPLIMLLSPIPALRLPVRLRRRKPPTDRSPMSRSLLSDTVRAFHDEIHER